MSVPDPLPDPIDPPSGWAFVDEVSHLDKRDMEAVKKILRAMLPEKRPTIVSIGPVPFLRRWFEEDSDA